MAKKDAFSMRINGLSILMLLILLCITVFAALALVSANAELKLSQKNSDHIADRAYCDRDAQQQLAALCDELAGGTRTADDGELITVESAVFGNTKIKATYIYNDGVLTPVEYKTVNIDASRATGAQAGQ